jgi:hypothetical protein
MMVASQGRAAGKLPSILPASNTLSSTLPFTRAFEWPLRAKDRVTSFGNFHFESIFF